MCWSVQCGVKIRDLQAARIFALPNFRDYQSLRAIIVGLFCLEGPPMSRLHTYTQMHGCVEFVIAQFGIQKFSPSPSVVHFSSFLHDAANEITCEPISRLTRDSRRVLETSVRLRSNSVFAPAKGRLCDVFHYNQRFCFPHDKGGIQKRALRNRSSRPPLISPHLSPLKKEKWK